MFSVHARQTHSMRTRDGIRLDADVYVPVGEGPFPVLLMRQPYGRAIASTIVYAHPCWYAAHGYIVVIQDVRGRGTSAGEFDLFAHEVDDAEDTLRWVAQLPKSDGQVGMYGFSYQGMTQLYAAQTQSPALKTIAPAMTGYHLYEDWAYENGALCLQLGLTWAIQLAAETARLQGAVSTHRKLLMAAHALPLHDPVPACPEVLKDVDSFFHDWLAHPHTDSYWKALTPQLEGVDLPTLHIGGWFDPYLRGDVRLYQELSASSQHQHHLWIGPWGHIPWGRKVGEIDFGRAAMSPVDRLQIQWFNALLKGKALVTDNLEHTATPNPHKFSVEHPVCLFEMGRNQWRRLPTWPGAELNADSLKTYFLHSDGLTNIREDSGVLSETSIHKVCQDNVVHDPWNPVPALGGHSAIPAGVFERTAVDARGDVLTYTSAPLTAEIRVAGLVEVVGEITSSAPSYDVCAVLSRVRQGKVYNLTQGYRRVEPARPDNPTEITLPLHPTCFNVAPGDALRLSLSLACFPSHPINPGTGVQPASARAIDAQIISAAITTGGPSGAKLLLPMISL